MKKITAAFLGLGALCAGTAVAQMTPGGIGMQPPNSALAEEVHWFHNILLMPIITAISLFVLALLLWIVFRYNSKSNPTPRKFSHNTMIEIVWTVIPILILLAIALPSFELLYKEDVIPDGKQIVAQGDGQTIDFVFPNDFDERRRVARAGHLNVIIDDGSEQRTLKNRKDFRVDGFGETNMVISLNEPPARGERVIIRGGRNVNHRGEVEMAPTVTIKAIGFQWGWRHAYPDFGDFEVSSLMAAEDQTTPELYRLEVDNRILVPVGETIRITTTATDVIHAWAMPVFAVKVDAVPGRINETWFNADREGVYYGQCSEICGIKHSFMPIAVEVVSRPAFEAWVDEQRAFAGLEPMFETDNVKLADASPADAAAAE
ncbi:MAG: hypothetical protein KJN99_14070 [Marinicaulis sp.]|nr:hypothetical protein [Marinicaulis sp.]